MVKINKLGNNPSKRYFFNMADALFEVLLPARMAHPLTYAIPPELIAQAVPGKRVLVPLGRRKLIGCLYRPDHNPPPKGLKPIAEIIDPEPLLTAAQLQMITFASHYYLTPIGEVFRHFLPPGLLKSQTLSNRRLKKARVPLTSDYQFPCLTARQEAVLADIRQGKNNVLLHGVTGSGKTEIYLQLTREVTARGGSVLILLPEIGLTPQLVDRFTRALAQPLALYHSGLTAADRDREWLKVARGEVQIAIGTRSSIFLPFRNLQLIVVDEEHDTSFKQDERFCYHARDLALWRGQTEQALVVLGSATPSLESLHRARLGKLQLLELPERPSGIPLPNIQLIDRRSKASGLFSEELLEMLSENLRRKEQSLVFLNRRGYAPALFCPRCGFSPRCPGCEITLTWHKGVGKLLCHYCDHSLPYSVRCPQCQIPSLIAQGTGTERVEEELKSFFQTARIARLDRDITARKGWEQILGKMRARELDILIGTQIIAKGHDYPFITLVGILDADVALHLPDFRASERAYQLVMQVAGRAGRKDRPGKVLVQTYSPEHVALQAVLHGGKDFLERELRQREAAGYPPYRRLIQVRFSGPRLPVISAAERAAQVFKKIGDGKISLQVLGPAPCPMEKVRGAYRWHLLLKTAQFSQLHPHLTRALSELEQTHIPSSVRLLVNVDPVDLM